MKRIAILIWLMLLAPILVQAQGMSPWGSAGGGAGTGDVTSVGNCLTGACDGTTTTWGDGTGPVVWTYSVTGTDPVLTMTASTFGLGAFNLTGTGSIGATGAGKFLKGWFTDLEVTNYPTVNGATVFNQAVTSTSNPAFSTINVVGANALSLGSSRTIDGVARFKSGTALNDFYHELRGANFASNTLWTFPTAVPGGANYLLNVDADGTMDYTNPGTFASLTSPTFVTSVGLPATLSSAAAVTWTLMDNQASGLSFGATGAADILKVGTLDAGPVVTVTGKLTATAGYDGTVGATTPAAGTFTSVISKKVVTHTTTGSVALTCAANSSGVFTNSGADADVTYTLEECLVGVEGCHFTFIITDFAVAGDEFWVDAHANDQFYGMYSTNANGDKLEGDNVLGSVLNVLCLKNTAGTYEWFTTGNGVWTDAN